MKKEIPTNKHHTKIYYHLIIFLGLFILVTNWLLLNENENLQTSKRPIIEYLNSKLRACLIKSSISLSHNVIKHSQSISSNQPNHDIYKYSSQFKTWTVSRVTQKEVKELASDDIKHSYKTVQTQFGFDHLQTYEECKNLINFPSQKSLNSSIVSQDYDRVLEQLTYLRYCLDGKTVVHSKDYNQGTILKIRPDRLDLESQKNFFSDEGCSVDKCEITYDWNEADALIFKNFRVDFIPEEYVRTEDQVWIAHTLESPTNLIRDRLPSAHKFNWTATYRHDSDIVTPYEKFVPYSDTVERYHQLSNLTYEDKKKYYHESVGNIKELIKNKKKNIVWFVSNCFTASRRENYIKSLSEHIDIDIYGRCGNLICPKTNHSGCLQMVNVQYRFYIAFENSKHQDYITEKLFNNGLGKNDLNHMMIPIVMGTSKEDYLKQGPKNAFIHVDDFRCPKELARFLLDIANDQILFHSYFIWKSMGKFIDTKFYCRVCGMLHYSRKNNLRKYYDDVNRWFAEENNPN